MDCQKGHTYILLSPVNPVFIFSLDFSILCDLWIVKSIFTYIKRIPSSLDQLHSCQQCCTKQSCAAVIWPSTSCLFSGALYELYSAHLESECACVCVWTGLESFFLTFSQFNITAADLSIVAPLDFDCAETIVAV